MSEFAKNEAGSQMRFTIEEFELIKRVFGGNEKLVKLLRKMFLPEYDPNAPLGQTIDLWLAAHDLKSMSHEEAYHHIIARNMVIGHIEAQIGQLSLLAAQVEETPEEKSTRDKKNSTQ